MPLKNSRRNIIFAACICAFLACSAGIYFFSDNTKVLAMTCTGNYYYTSQQVYKIAGVGIDSSTLVNSASKVEDALESDPLIEQASVSITDRKVDIAVQEKFIIGYIVEDGVNYLISTDNERIAVHNDDLMESLIHFPLISDLSDVDLADLCETIKENQDVITRSLLEKVAEITTWSESFESGMIKMLMQDGNTIYTDIDDLSVLIHYDAILPKLASTNACLGMESTESAQTIFTMACDYMEQTSEERAMDRTIPKTAVGVWSMEEAKSYAEQQEELARQQAEAEAAQKAYEEEQEQKKKEEAAMQAVKEANPQTEEEAQQEEAEQSALQQQIEEANSAQDWAQSQYSWLEYSESTGLYRSVYTQELFAYDESAGGFVSIQ